MLPIIAVGAFFTGTLLLGAAASNKTEPSGRTRSPPPQMKEHLVSPTAYVVVPVQQPEKSPKGEPVSVVDLIGKMIF